MIILFYSTFVFLPDGFKKTKVLAVEKNNDIP